MPTPGKDYDVFLSHNSADKPEVETLARRLEDEAHLTPFLDKWRLVPANPWQEELERALDRSDTCAVFIGPTGIGPWHNEEMRSALDERVKHPGFRVVPVLLPGSTLPERGQLPRFLRRLTWVDFRGPKGLNDAGAFQRLVAGIRGVPPGRGTAGTLGVLTTECPYRGLEAFDEAHARFFFGREAEIQHLLEALRTASFLAVIGPSGSGKSSLVRAGLLPQLQAGAVPQSAQWHYSILKPGVHPLEELAVSLAQLTRRTDVQSLLESLAAHEHALHWQTRLLLSGQSEHRRVCFVIDQFEEVFTLCEDQTEQQCFINALRYAATVVGGQTIVVLTMRADFVPRAAEYPPLAELLSDHQFLISQMDGEDLRRVIEEPARLVGVTLAPGLTAQMLQDVGREPGILPLLEHALLQLWQKRRSDNVLTLAAYREIGGVHGALAQRAEEIFAGFSPEQQAIVRRILLRLTQPGESTEDTRRRATLSELQTWGDTQQAVQQVVEKLADARLLVTSEEQVDVAHEALIRGWPRLRRWIDEDLSALRTHRRITEAAQEWQRLHRDEGALFRGIPLAQAQEWREGHEGELNALEREFLNANVALKQRIEAEENTRRQRELEQAQIIAAERATANKRLWWGIRVLCTLMLIVLAVAWYASRQQKRAEQQTALALSRGLAAEARNYLNKQLDLALLLSVEANRQAKTAEARQALYTALDAASSSIFLHGYWDELRELAFSPNGKALASGGTVGTLLLWDLSVTPPNSTPLAGHQGDVRALAFSPDGQTLVSGDENGMLLLWDLNELPPAGEALLGHHSALGALAFSSDGQRLASGDAHGTVFLWDLGGVSPRSTPLPSNHVGVQAFRFSPNGKTLAAVDYRGTFLAWDLSSTLPSSISLPSSWGDVRTFTFSPSGGSLALGSMTGTLLLWDLSTTPPEKEDLPGHQGNVRALALSSNDNILASGDQSSTLLLWDLSTTPPHSTTLSGHQDGIWRLALSPNGRILASGDGRGTLWLWDLSGTKPRPISLPGHQGAIERLAFSPSGTALASSDNKGTFLLWELSTTPPVEAFRSGHREGVSLFAFSPDGKTLASIDYHGSFLVWKLNTTQPVRTALRGHRGGIEKLIFSPDGKMLAVHAMDRWPLVWDLRETPPRSTFLPGHQSALGALALSPDGKLLATGDRNRTLLWDLSVTPLRSTPLLGHQENIWRLTFSPDGQWLASSDGSSILLWDLQVPHLQPTPLSGNQGRVQAFAFSPDGKTLASGGTAGTLLLWDLRGVSPISTPMPGHQASVSMLAFSPGENEKLLVSGDDKSTLLLWDLRGTSPRFTALPSHSGYRRTFTFSPDGRTLALDIDGGSLLLLDVSGRQLPISLHGRQDAVTGLTFNPNGKSLASGGIGGTLLLWDLSKTPPPSRLFSGFQEPVRAFTFSPDSTLLVSGDQEGTLLLLDLSVTPPMSILLPHDQRHARPLTFSPDGKTLATGGNGGPILWNLDFEAWPNHACRIANRNLTCAEWAQFIKDEPYRPTCENLPLDQCQGSSTSKIILE